MELKFKKSFLFVLSFLLISLLLILSNGCEKSEPSSGSSTNTSNMNAMTHDMEGMEDMPTESVTAENGQTLCPVMKGNPIDTDIFVEYEGKKVYFCCNSCKATFLANPEKYLADLPQFNEQEN